MMSFVHIFDKSYTKSALLVKKIRSGSDRDHPSEMRYAQYHLLELPRLNTLRCPSEFNGVNPG